MSKLKEARSLLEVPKEIPQKVEAAKENISEGIDLEQNWQSITKLVDSSELGWRLVKEHVINAIADNPDYDKRMNRAEATEEM